MSIRTLKNQFYAEVIINKIYSLTKKSFSFMRDYISMYVCLSYIHQ